jgi:serine protease Do
VPQLLQQLNSDLSDLVKNVRGSIVEVRNGRGGAGAGTIWHPRGLILTNAHVVGRRTMQVVLPSGETYPARLLAADPEQDLAALSIEASDLPTIPLGDSKSLAAGQVVLALGHPWGINHAVTAGVVLGMAAERRGQSAWTGRRRDVGTGREWVVVNLQLRPGNSGGPLLDVAGRMIGINSIMTGPRAGMAIPIHAVKDFLRRTLGTEAPSRHEEGQAA